THFTKDEHYTLMSLWCIARSPLIFGGNMPKNDDFTLSLLTNDDVIAVNQHSTNNRQLFNRDDHIAWVGDVEGSSDKYVAMFNANPAPPPGRGRGRRNAQAPTQPAAAETPTGSTSTEPVKIAATLEELGVKGPVNVRDLWTRQDLGVMNDA